MGRGQRIEAAGVVLVRPGLAGPEVAVVHRPHRADWSLPKGKLDPGERHDVAAVRETLEETGVRCRLGPSLGSRKYLVEGEPKRVRYWRATVAEQHPREADAEVDDVRWVTHDDAHDLLTYDDDRALISVALALPDSTPTIVLRHAEATKRAHWKASGDPLAEVDAARPLTAYGLAQADRIAPVLWAYDPTVVVASSSRRCQDTVAPYAAQRGLVIGAEPTLSEEGYRSDPDATVATVRRLLGIRTPSVWCTHRPVMPTVLSALADHLEVRTEDGGLPPRFDPRLKPGAGIVVHRAADGRVVGVDRFET